MNYKAFTLILFVLIFCLSSIMASRRILTGPGSTHMETRPRHPPGDKSATIQQPPAAPQHLTYRAIKKTVTVCNEKVHGNCIHSPPTVTRCNLGERCKRTVVP
ncbi:hypothetical protein AABB24_008955 [Solanum stoloniferum]|uniref:Uncharacterized protein n=1 Tax=Solanum stoloniferum TaxID=62892 RepID=A0ABD2UG79_9SOLN